MTKQLTKDSFLPKVYVITIFGYFLGAGGGAFSFSNNAPGSNMIRPTATFGFGQQQQSLFQPQQQQQPQPSETDLIDYAVYACSVFGDDRDDVLRRWNMLQVISLISIDFKKLTTMPYYHITMLVCRTFVEGSNNYRRNRSNIIHQH